MVFIYQENIQVKSVMFLLGLRIHNKALLWTLSVQAYVHFCVGVAPPAPACRLNVAPPFVAVRFAVDFTDHHGEKLNMLLLLARCWCWCWYCYGTDTYLACLLLLLLSVCYGRPTQWAKVCTLSYDPLYGRLDRDVTQVCGVLVWMKVFCCVAWFGSFSCGVRGLLSCRAQSLARCSKMSRRTPGMRLVCCSDTNDRESLGKIAEIRGAPRSAARAFFFCFDSAVSTVVVRLPWHENSHFDKCNLPSFDRSKRR